MYIEGLYPSLDVCVLCGAKTALSRFSAENGGVVCAHCAAEFGGLYMDETALSALKDMQDVMPGDAGALRLEREAEDKLLRALILYLDHVLQKPLKSAEMFLKTL
jgi:recombinational DNA repair protein (RecF pathway)